MPSSAYTPPPAIYTLSLHDALPISRFTCSASPARRYLPYCSFGKEWWRWAPPSRLPVGPLSRSRHFILCRSFSMPSPGTCFSRRRLDRKSTRLNSSHRCISYAVFCLYSPPRYLHSFPTRRSSDLTIYLLGFTGAALFTILLVRQGVVAVGAAVATAGWAIVAIAAFHSVPILLDAIAWHVLFPKAVRSEEHTSELQSPMYLVCRLLLILPPPLSTLFPYTTLFRSHDLPARLHRRGAIYHTARSARSGGGGRRRRDCRLGHCRDRGISFCADPSRCHRLARAFPEGG